MQDERGKRHAGLCVAFKIMSYDQKGDGTFFHFARIRWGAGVFDFLLVFFPLFFSFFIFLVLYHFSVSS